MEIKLKDFKEWQQENDVKFEPFEFKELEDLDSSATEEVVMIGKPSFNEFTVEDWTEIPGIGKTLAKRLVEGGPYEELEDLSEVRGISQRVLENIKTYLSP